MVTPKFEARVRCKNWDNRLSRCSRSVNSPATPMIDMMRNVHMKATDSPSMPWWFVHSNWSFSNRRAVTGSTASSYAGVGVGCFMMSSSGARKYVSINQLKCVLLVLQENGSLYKRKSSRELKKMNLKKTLRNCWSPEPRAVVAPGRAFLDTLELSPLRTQFTVWRTAHA